MESIFVDFNNTDTESRVRLIVNGTLRDLETKNIVLTAGMKLLLDDDQELKAIGTVEFSETENVWVATIEWID